MDTHISNDNNNPINYNGKSRDCDCCGVDESRTYFVEDTETCEDCYYSCCGDELDQDIRRCPTCGENN